MHKWQDIVLAAGLVFFNLALVPSLFSHNKPAFATSALTATVVLTVLAVYVSLSLWFAAFMSATNFLLWATLAVQVWRRRRN